MNYTKTLYQAARTQRQELNSFKNRDAVIREFNKKPVNERMSLFHKLRGKKANFYFISEYDILKIMNYI